MLLQSCYMPCINWGMHSREEGSREQDGRMAHALVQLHRRVAKQMRLTAELCRSDPISIIRSVGSIAMLSPSLTSTVAVAPLNPSLLIASTVR